MKTILRGSVAALAIASLAGAAQAQTNERHYAAPLPISLPFIGNQITLTNPQNATFLGFPIGGPLTAAADGLVNGGFGTRYVATADAPGDTTPATPSVSVAFSLSGSVNKDCSFYAGNNSNAQNIDFGVIGVRTGNNENVSDAFEMVGPAVADIESLTAGCNFNNTVSLEKANGIDGMVNANPGGYDSDEFQANIPYVVQAAWRGVAVNTVGAGTPQSLTVQADDDQESIDQGAWRSDFAMNINAPIADLALVAGDYSDTLTLTLAAQ